MFNLVAWDLIPTLVMHRYYCNSEAGYWVYKTPEQWVSENPRAAERLLNYQRNEPIDLGSDWIAAQFNDRFRIETSRPVEVFHAISRKEQIYRDVVTDEKLLFAVEFRLGSGRASFQSGGSLEAWRRAFIFGWFGRGQCEYWEKDNAPNPFSDNKHLYYLIGVEK